MTVYKTTKEILNDPWGVNLPNTVTPSLQEYCHNWRELSIDDINTWEQIYFQPGHVGIYAAWSPLTEYYIIVFNLFVDSKYGIEKFYGTNAEEEVRSRAAELGIQLIKSNVWINQDHMWMKA